MRVRSPTSFSRSRLGLLASSSSMVGTAASAVAGLAAQPAEEGAHQKLRVQAIGLRPPVLARYHNARGVDHMGLDAVVRSQRASQKPSGHRRKRRRYMPRLQNNRLEARLR